MTRLIHGEEALAAAQRISESLFAEDQSHLTESDFEQLALDGLPTFEVSESLNVVETLVKTGLASSNKEARGFVNSKAVCLTANLPKPTIRTMPLKNLTMLHADRRTQTFRQIHHRPPRQTQPRFVGLEIIFKH